MSSIAALADAMYADEVARARAMSPEEKLFEGPRLFERACRVMIDGIRDQRPDLDDAGARVLLAARLTLLRALERQ